MLLSLALTSPPAPATAVRDGLLFVEPYPFIYRTRVKQRWTLAPLIDVFTAELYGPRSVWERAAASGALRVNGAPVTDRTVARTSDVVTHRVHFHEMPVSASDRPRVLNSSSSIGGGEGEEAREYLAVYKPAGMPTHVCGHYRYNALTTTLALPALYPVHRLDKATSGVVVFARSADAARRFQSSRAPGRRGRHGNDALDALRPAPGVRVYLARVRGKFPHSSSCSSSLSSSTTTLSSQGVMECNVSLALVRNSGGYARAVPCNGAAAAAAAKRHVARCKPALTTFERLWYDARTDTSLVRCVPLTGRTHQIRAHLQHTGYPIANDAAYGGRVARDAEHDAFTNPTVHELFHCGGGGGGGDHHHHHDHDDECRHCPYAAPLRWRREATTRQLAIWLHSLSFDDRAASGVTASTAWPLWATPA